MTRGIGWWTTVTGGSNLHLPSKPRSYWTKNGLEIHLHLSPPLCAKHVLSKLFPIVIRLAFFISRLDSPTAIKVAKLCEPLKIASTHIEGFLSFSSILLLIIVRALILFSPKRNFVRLSLHPLVITIASLEQFAIVSIYRRISPAHILHQLFFSLNVALSLLNVLVDMCRSNTWDIPYI